MMKNGVSFAIVLAVLGICVASIGVAGVARTDRKYPYTWNPDTGVQCGTTGRELDLSTAREVAEIARVLPGAALLWKQVAKEPGQYVGFYIYPNDHEIKVYADTQFLVWLKDGSLFTSEAWYTTDDGETQCQLWSSEDYTRSGLKLNPAWMLSTEKGSIVIGGFYPLGSFRLSDMKEVGVKRIKVDGEFTDILPGDEAPPSENVERR